jgi:hypothetical protein
MTEIKMSVKKCVSVALASSAFVLAATGISFASMPDASLATNIKSKNATQVTIPSRAVQVAPDVFSLGNAIDPQTGGIVEGYMIIHRKKGEARSGGQGGAKAPTCYGYLADGAKWKTVEPWVMNTANTRGVDGATAFSIISNSISKWEDASDGVVGNGVFSNILGNGSTTSATLVADNSTPDNLNEVYFGSIVDASAIAVTTVWGNFGGPTRSRQLSEWDMVFDQVKFDWGTNGAVNKMDLENIATHELGHAVGMADLYNSCTLETMYGYGTEGQTIKRDLNTGDIQGLNNLY